MGQSIQTSNPYFVGHSLVNFAMPAFVDNLAKSGGKTSEYAVQVMNGANIQSNYNNWSSAQGTPYTTALPTGKYDAFILTEAVPLVNHIEWSNTYKVANDFLTYARTYKPNTRFFIYETWHCTNTGRTDTIIPEIAPHTCWYDKNDQLLWQPRLKDDFSKWAKIVDSVRTLQNYDQVFMVPAGQAFYNLSKEIDEGKVPGYSSFRQFFTDDIHLNLSGNYFIACVMYACIFRTSPEGLTIKRYNEWGNLWLELPTQIANIMQKVAWETVCSNRYSGVNCTITSNSLNEQSDLVQISIYPQPVSNILTINIQDESLNQFSLTNNMGNIIEKGILNHKSNQIDLSHVTPGIYTLVIHNEKTVVTKKINIIK